MLEMEGQMAMESGAVVNETGAINVRLKLSALWVALLFVFAYVDIFAAYRADIIGGVLEGRIAGFQVDQTFLLLTTIYVAIPSVMVFLTLVLRPRVAQWATLILAALYMLSIVASTIGETWWYYYLGSAIECVLLAAAIRYAWRWRSATR
jgi:hypothetical protein